MALAANGQDPNVCGARNLENDPWSAWYGTQNEQTNGCGAPNGCGNVSGDQSRFNTVHGPGGMTPQVAAYQQILNLLPAIGGPATNRFVYRKLLGGLGGFYPVPFGVPLWVSFTDFGFCIWEFTNLYSEIAISKP